MYTQARLEEIMGRKIVDAEAVYRGMEAASVLKVYGELGVLERAASGRVAELRAAAAVLGEVGAAGGAP